jgi:hypothetical protein
MTTTTERASITRPARRPPAHASPAHQPTHLHVRLTESYVIEDDVLLFLAAGSIGIVNGARRDQGRYSIAVLFERVAVLDSDGDGAHVSQWIVDVRPEHLTLQRMHDAPPVANLQPGHALAHWIIDSDPGQFEHETDEHWHDRLSDWHAHTRALAAATLRPLPSATFASSIRAPARP